jgi:hypothetical protein
MSRFSQGPGGEQRRPQSFTNNLNAYALAAGAAGVSMLAMVQPAEADIVFTPENKQLPVNTFLPIDLNHDGAADFRLLLGTFHYHNFTDDLSIWPLDKNRIAQSSKGFAAALAMGAPIGPNQTLEKTNRLPMVETHGFRYGSTFTGVYSRHVYGPWINNTQSRYLGVGFTIDGAIHYGWIRVAVVLQFERVQATITGYAYETVASQKIHAGQLTEEASALESAPMAQPSLGALALGSPGLELWRREDSVSGKQTELVQ